MTSLFEMAHLLHETVKFVFSRVEYSGTLADFFFLIIGFPCWSSNVLNYSVSFRSHARELNPTLCPA